MNRVGTKSGLIPEEHLRASRLRSTGNGRIGFPLPLLDRFRITLIGALQWLLRGKSQPRQELTHCGDPRSDPNFFSINSATTARVHRPKSRPYWRGSRPLTHQTLAAPVPESGYEDALSPWSSARP